MKNLLPLVVLFLFALGACTEYIEVEKIVIVRDSSASTQKLPTFKDRLFVGLDSISIPVNIPVPVVQMDDPDQPTVVYRDSIVYVVRVDSIFITKTVYLTDTIVERIYEYGDTLFQYGIHNTYDVDPEIEPLITEFYKQAFAHGKTPNGGEMIVKVEKMDAVLQAYSYDFYGQVVIKVNSNLTSDERLLPVWREMARLTLGKEYSQTPGDYMYPFTNANSIRVSSPQSEKEKFWNEIILAE